MRKLLYALLLMFVGLFIIGSGCSDENPVAPEEEFSPPRNLTYRTDTTSVRLFWQPSTDRNIDDFLGYYVYVAESSIVSLTADSLLNAYKVNQQPLNDTTVSVTGLTRGQRYFFHIRAAKGVDHTEYTLSNPSNEVHTSPVIIKTGTLYEFSSPLGNPSGFNFAEGTPYSMTAANANSIDIYLGTTAEGDGSADLVLKSPDKVSSTNPAWDSRVSEIKSLGTGFDNFNQTDDSGWASNGYEIIMQGRVYAIKTPQNHFVKLEVTATSGSYPNRTITFRYAYQTITAYGHFK